MSFFSSIPLWGWIDIFGNFAVLVALCGELDKVLKWLVPKKPNQVPSAEWRRKKLKKKFELLLVLGIAVEVGCLPISLIESAALNKEAGEARRLASDANEGAESLVSSNLILAAQMELLRSNNFALQLKLQPRTINAQQIKDFIFLTEKMPKIPVRIGIGGGAYSEEALNFAINVKDLLGFAKYPPLDSTAMFAWGIHSDPTATYIFGTNETEERPYVMMMIAMPDLLNPQFEATNGFRRPVVAENDLYGTFAGLYYAFKEAGITIGLSVNSTWVKTNECEIFILQKQ